MYCELRLAQTYFSYLWFEFYCASIVIVTVRMLGTAEKAYVSH